MLNKILFINAIDPARDVQSYLPPLGLASLAASIKSKFGNLIECRIIDRDVDRALIDYKPDLVGISSVTENYNFAKNYAHLAKLAGARVVIGGQHVTALPQTITSDMDFAVIGEGERAIIDVLTHQNGTRYYARDSVKNLDELPAPDRSLLPKTEHGSIFSARGCPYHCVFCASTRFWPNLRMHSAERFVSEIQDIVASGVNYIEIWDDLFIADRKRLKAIAKQINGLGIADRVRFSCNVRANLVDGDLAATLKLMNVDLVFMGLESGNDRILHYLKPNGATVAQNALAIEILNNFSIKPFGSFIIGSPTETKAEILETLNFIKKNKLEGFTVHLLVPLPGTPIWDYANARRLVSNNMDWSRLRMTTWENFDNAVILSETLPRGELKVLFREFLNMVTINTIKRTATHPWTLVQKLPKAIDYTKRIITGKPTFGM